jgi:hypothetical protein
MVRFLGVFGAVLVLGSLGHSLGIARLYLSAGVPSIDRVVIDLWVAEAQLMSGVAFICAARALARGRSWRALATFAAVNIIGFAAVMLPVVSLRAPVGFRIPQAIYLFAACWVLLLAARTHHMYDGKSERRFS